MFSALNQSQLEKLPILDWETHLSVKWNGDEKSAILLLSTLADDLLEMRPQLIDYFENQDWSNLRVLLHTLKGGISFCAVPRLEAVHSQVHQAIKNGDVLIDFQLFINILDETQRTIEHFKKK